MVLQRDTTTIITVPTAALDKRLTDSIIRYLQLDKIQSPCVCLPAG